jgi:hypothetical protein
MSNAISARYLRGDPVGISTLLRPLFEGCYLRICRGTHVQGRYDREISYLPKYEYVRNIYKILLFHLLFIETANKINAFHRSESIFHLKYTVHVSARSLRRWDDFGASPKINKIEA